MEKTANVSPAREEGVDWEAAVQGIFEQMEQADTRIREYHEQIDQLGAETRTILAQLREQLPGKD